MALIGLDIGGTKLLVAAADREGKILRTVHAPTPKGKEEGLTLLKKLVCEVVQGEPIEGMGASCGGPLQADEGIVSPLHQPEWRNVPLREIFSQEFQCPFRVEVDTDAAALAEYRYGPAHPSRLLYLTLSTGMGGGFLVDGKIYRGANGVHPEAAHQVIPHRLKWGTGPTLCECGATGCLEALVSGNGIRRIYGKPAENLTADEWEEVGYNLGLGLINISTLYAPDLIVFGGGISLAAHQHFLPQAESVLRNGLRLVPPPQLIVSSLGYHTALLGSIALAQDCVRGLSSG